MVGSGLAPDSLFVEEFGAMNPTEMQDVVNNCDRRLASIEQILPTLATKADLERFATKPDLGRFATKADLEPYATKADLESGLARVRAVTEQVRDEVRALAEGYMTLSGRVDSLSTEVRGVAFTLETLVTRLAAKGVI